MSGNCIFEDEGKEETQILKEIRVACLECNDYKKGHILNSICTEPLEIAKKAYMEAINTNLGDERLFSGARNIEVNVMKKLGELLGLREAVGSIVSGGTEANLLAMFVAKRIGEERGILKPEIVAPLSIHFSVVKAATLLGIQLNLSEIDENFRAVPGSIEKLITKNTISIFATAGTSEAGAIDPIEEIADICRRRDIYFHVDAASGGYIIPFAKELGYNLPEFDFKVNGVQSITIDPHKYGLSVIPSGFILFRNERLQSYINFESFFIGTRTHRTLSGTRTGAGAMSTYAVSEKLGKKGYKRLAQNYFTLRNYLIQELASKGFEILGTPDLNIVMIKSKNAIEVMNEFEKMGWYVSVSKRCNALRIVVHQHNSIKELKEFVELLYEIENRMI